MLKKVKQPSFSILRTYIVMLMFVALSACATKTDNTKIAIQDMNCIELLTAIESAQTNLDILDKEISQSMDVGLGGVVSAQGGSSSGVGVGVGISLGAPLNSYRKRKAVLKAEELRSELLNLQSEAVNKQCYS